jgi:spore germination protein GerM
MNRPIVIGIILFVIVFATIFVVLKRRGPENQNAEPQQPQAAPAAPSQTQSGERIERRINAKLFFNQPGSTQLAAEERYVSYRETLHDQATEVLIQLIQGPQKNLDPPIPKGTQLRDLFITKDGVAYVDFSSELATNHIGGSLAEINTVYSIVNTLTFNFPQIKRVQILLDDKAVESLKGHLDLTHPLKPDMSLVINITEADSEKKS